MTREEAIAVLGTAKYELSNQVASKYCKAKYEAVNMAIKALGQEPRWIPVSERLPEEGETVLVCYRTQGGFAQSVCEWFDMPNRGIVWSTLCGEKPIAWMSLPKPYKAESEDEK